MATVIVRAGAVGQGTYNINVRRGRLEMLFGSIKVDVRGAQVQVHGETGAGAGMARAGAVGGLLLGGAGIALGVLAAKKGLVLFEAKLTDGRAMIGQCTPLDFQELVIATHSTAPDSVPARATEQPEYAMWVGLGLSSLMLVWCLSSLRTSQPPKATAAAAPAPAPPDLSALQAQEEQRRAAAREQAKQLTADIEPFDGTARSAQKAVKAVMTIVETAAVDCELANLLADDLHAKGHARAIARLSAAMRKKEGCEPIQRQPAPDPKRTKGPGDTSKEEFLDELIRRPRPAVPAAKPQEPTRPPSAADPWG